MSIAPQAIIVVKLYMAPLNFRACRYHIAIELLKGAPNLTLLQPRLSHPLRGSLSRRQYCFSVWIYTPFTLHRMSPACTLSIAYCSESYKHCSCVLASISLACLCSSLFILYQSLISLSITFYIILQLLHRISDTYYIAVIASDI